MSKTMRWSMYILVCGYVLFLCWLFPIHSKHDWLYAQQGNAFLLQWNEFLQLHGRFLTHVPLRLTLQQGNFFYFLMKAILIITLYSTAFLFIPKNYFSRIFFIFINAILPLTTFLMYFVTDSAIMYSYYITIILVLLFFRLYLDIFKNSSSPNLFVLYFLAFLVGASFEQSVSIIPMIIFIFILLKIKKVSIPKWYWSPLLFFLLGFSILLVSPGTKNREISYAKAENWEFLGQTLNWMQLGWERYFYALYRHVFVASQKDWFNSPGFLPSTLYIQMVIIFFTLLNWRKYRLFWHDSVMYPVILWLFSWSTCIVMAISPLYHGMTMEFGKFFLYISLTQSTYFIVKDFKARTLSIISCLLLVVALTGQLIQVIPIFKARQEYIKLEKAIERGEIAEAKLPEARLGNILIIKFGDGLPLKYPYFRIIE